MTRKFTALTVSLAAAAAFAAAARPAACADADAGTSAAQFLKIGAGARAAAMAEAQAAVADDVYAAYYNPAGLAAVKRPMMGAMHAQYVQEARYQYGAVALPLDEGAGGVLGLSISNLGVSDLERRTQDTDLPVGLFEASNFSYALSYARRVTDRLSLGVTGKLVSVSIDEVSGRAAAADLGLRYRPELGLSFPVDLGLAARNFGTGLKLGSETDPLPSAVAGGIAARPYPGLLAALDLIRYRDTHTIIAVGGEYTRGLSARLQGTARAGYSNHRKDIEGVSGVTLGAGLSLPTLAFDFAWVPFGDLGNTFRYSVRVQF
ncbi:MAG: PorV/PorQ family protein [Elusimicrobiales bacterium]